MYSPEDDPCPTYTCRFCEAFSSKCYFFKNTSVILIEFYCSPSRDKPFRLALYKKWTSNGLWSFWTHKTSKTNSCLWLTFVIFRHTFDLSTHQGVKATRCWSDWQGLTFCRRNKDKTTKIPTNTQNNLLIKSFPERCIAAAFVTQCLTNGAAMSSTPTHDGKFFNQPFSSHHNLGRRLRSEIILSTA